MTDIENIMDYTAILIHDRYGRRTYNRLIIDGFPNYFLSGEKPRALSDLGIDECYFFPISMSVFNKDRRHKFYGLKYVFTAAQHDVVDLGIV